MRKWKYRMAAGTAAAAAVCGLGAGVLLYTHSASGKAVPPQEFGPIPCQGEPADVIALSALERLGKSILYDCTMSYPEGYACASCHMPQAGFTSPYKGGASDINLFLGPMPGVVPGRYGNRRPMSYAYAAFSPIGPYYDSEFAAAYVGGDFWDGRVPDLTLQATEPFINPDEMDNTPTNGVYPPPLGGYSALVAQKATTKYRTLFEKAYGKGIIERTTREQQYFLTCAAEAAFEGSAEVCQFSSKYDASKYGVPPQDKYTLSASEARGRQLYFGNAICSTCHSAALFPPVLEQTNGKDTFAMYCFANIGVPRNPGNPFYLETDCTSNPHGCNPQGFKYVDYGLGANPNPAPDGTKFYNTTPGDIPQFRGLFQTPTVRNVDVRPNNKFVKAYMHNGVFKSLKEVVHFYNKRNIAVDSKGNEVAFDWRTGPPAGYTPLFAPPEVIDNVQNVQGALGNIGNLGLTDQQEKDLVAFMQILSDGFTAPNGVGLDPAKAAKAALKRISKPKPKATPASQ
jgi:cytochrome c peroxidase